MTSRGSAERNCRQKFTRSAKRGYRCERRDGAVRFSLGLQLCVFAATPSPRYTPASPKSTSQVVLLAASRVLCEVVMLYAAALVAVFDPLSLVFVAALPWNVVRFGVKKEARAGRR